MFELPDNDLMDLLLARKEPEGELDVPHIQHVLTLLRSVDPEVRVRVQVPPAGSKLCANAETSTLPLWGGAHHLRHLWLDFGGLRSDGFVGSLCYGGALVGSLLAIVAVIRL